MHSAPFGTDFTILLFVGATVNRHKYHCSPGYLMQWLGRLAPGIGPDKHAATMVTAGIYMIARSNILFTLAPDTMHIIAIIGLATAIFAALIALTQTDIKKVLAYSANRIVNWVICF